MLFIFRQKPVIVDAFTSHPGIFEESKVAPALNFVPNWYKAIPTKDYTMLPSGVITRKVTMTTCAGFNDLYRNSWTMPLWSDLIVRINQDFSWVTQWADQASLYEIISHDPGQHGYSFPDKVHLKLISPWLFKEKLGINWLFAEPTWHFLKYNAGIRVLPGIVNYKYQNSTHINVFADVVPNKQYPLYKGQPLVHLTPLTERKVIFKHHLLTDQEFERMNRAMTHSSFIHGYLKRKRRMDADDKPKCPFHFGD